MFALFHAAAKKDQAPCFSDDLADDIERLSQAARADKLVVKVQSDCALGTFFK